ncbi:urease accessory protein UreD [Paeniroseomonas aquatica]|uniref:urease accessory protein UreD n=1 Tax=Paeniroseomonas aquatica TaxID=373043 RepID=UPI00361758DD
MRQSVRLEAGARATVCTAAAEKVYRSLGPDSRIETTLSLGAGAWLEWLPQETILFDGARLARGMRTVLEPGHGCWRRRCWSSAARRGERMAAGMVFDRWRLHGPEGLLWADALDLPDPGRLASPSASLGPRRWRPCCWRRPGWKPTATCCAGCRRWRRGR